MKVLLLTTSLQGGGAANASLRLLHALREQGVDARLLALFADNHLRQEPYIDSVYQGKSGKLLTSLYKAFERLDIILHNGLRPDLLWRFSSAPLSPDTLHHPWIEWAEVIHLHWVNHGLLSLRSIAQLTKLSKPIFWTLHDLWAVTGGCHLPLVFGYKGIDVCPQYTRDCSSCPMLKQLPNSKSYSQKILADKLTFFQDNIAYITVSQREQELVRLSPIFQKVAPQLRTIAPPLSTYLSEPLIENLLLPEWYDPQTKYLLMVASRLDDLVKGPYLLEQMLGHLAQQLGLSEDHSRIELLLVGDIKGQDLLRYLPLPTHYLGRQSGISLRQLYALATLTLSTSIFETFGLTLVESLAEGTPVLAFRAYGAEDIIINQVNGYLIDRYDAQEMANKVLMLIADVDSGRITAESCRQSIRRFSSQVIAEQHIAYYKERLLIKH